MKASELALAMGEIVSKVGPDAILVPSLGNLAIRENDSDSARFLGRVVLKTGEVEWWNVND